METDVTHEWWSKIKTALVVAGITLLIWLAADQNVAEDQEITINVALSTKDSNRYVGFAEAPYTRSIQVTFKGRRNRLSEFNRQADALGVLIADLDDHHPTSSTPVELSYIEDILPHIKQIRESRLTIMSAEPQNAMVRIDEYVTVSDIRVRPHYRNTRIAPDFLRNTVSAQMPKFVAERIGEAPIAIAIPREEIESNTKGGTFVVDAVLTFDVLDQLDPNIRINFSPTNTVKISGKIEALTTTESKGPVQINWSIPNEIQRDFVIVTDHSTFRVHIDVTGPRDRLAQLDPRNIRAFVDVFAGDADNPGPGKEIVRDVRFMLPPDFSDCAIAPDAQRHQVRFRLEPRPATTKISPAIPPQPD